MCLNIIFYRITEDSIHTPYLREIFAGNTAEAKEALSDERLKHEKKWALEFEHDCLLAFWLAVDRGNIEIAKQLLDYDYHFRYIATLAFKRRKEKPARQKESSKDGKKKKAKLADSDQKNPDAQNPSALAPT